MKNLKELSSYLKILRIQLLRSLQEAKSEILPRLAHFVDWCVFPVVKVDTRFVAN